MGATVLQLGQDAADELSLGRPSALIGVTNSSTAQKLAAQLRRTCRMLGGRHDWSFLRRERTFTSLAQEEQTAIIPADFLRFIQGSEAEPVFWNRTNQQPFIGPLTPGQWQSRQASLVSGVQYQFYVRGTSVLVIPTMSAGDTVAFEYITSAIGLATDGTTQRLSFAADTDTTFFDDELVVLGMVWRYRKAEGQDYSEEYREFELRLADMIKMDGGRTMIRMGTEHSGRSSRPPPQDYTVVDS